MKFTLTHYKPQLTNQLMAKALACVAEEYGISTKDMTGRYKNSLVCEARMMFWFLLKICGGNERQSAAFVGRTRTSVPHAIYKCATWMRVYPDIRKRYDRIVENFNRI
jgi:chromosomal replication initiation ATPase DnaA